MTEPTPELRALAEALFAAGRAERPAPALGRRLMLIDPRGAGSTVPQQTVPQQTVPPQTVPPQTVPPQTVPPQTVPPQTVPRQPMAADEEAAARGSRRYPRAQAAFWVAAAAVIVAGVGAAFSMAPEPASIAISAERVTRSSPAATSEPSDAVTKVEAPQRASTLASAEARRVEPDPLAIGARPPRTAVSGALAKLPGKAARRAGNPRVSSAPEPARGVLAEAPLETPALSSERAAAAAVETSSRATPRGLSLRDELQLLGRARARLRAGEAAEALDLLDRHGRERSGRGLDAEATLLRVETYAALGRHDDASALAEQFVRDNPNSALGDRARSFIRPVPAVRAP